MEDTGDTSGMSNFPLNLRLKQRSVLPSTGVTPLAKSLSGMAMQTPGGPSQFPGYASQSTQPGVNNNTDPAPSGNGSGPGPMSQQIPMSQGLGTQGFGGPDFITPQEAQFACVYDPNEKENCQLRSPANLSPGRHKRPRFGYDPTPSQPDQSQLGSQPPNTQPMSQNWGGSSQQPLSQGDFLQRANDNSNSNGAEREGLFRMPPPRAPSRSGIVKAAKSPPCHRNAFLDDDEQPAEVPAHARVGGKDAHITAAQLATMSRFRADFVDLGNIGRGGFCKVMRVINRLDGAMYAVKRTERKLQTERERLEAYREVQAMAALSSHTGSGVDNVVRYFGAWTERDRDGDHLFIQLELCDGNLSSMQHRACELLRAARDDPDDVAAQRRASDARFGEAKIAALLRQMAAALACAHSRNVAHLDVKPENILVKGGVYKLGDWGRAAPVDGVGNQSFGANNSARSAISAEEGDARYLAPELLRGEVRVKGSIRGGADDGAPRDGGYGQDNAMEPESPTEDAMCSGPFGSAGVSNLSGPNLSLPGDFVGLDRADIFSLGATAYELACGSPLPSHGDEYQALRQGKIPALVGFSVSFQQMICGMMREDPSSRPTARALLKSQALAEAERVEEDKPGSGGGLFGA